MCFFWLSDKQLYVIKFDWKILCIFAKLFEGVFVVWHLINAFFKSKKKKKIRKIKEIVIPNWLCDTHMGYSLQFMQEFFHNWTWPNVMSGRLCKTDLRSIDLFLAWLGPPAKPLSHQSTYHHRRCRCHEHIFFVLLLCHCKVWQLYSFYLYGYHC